MEKLEEVIVEVQDAEIWAGLRHTGHYRGVPAPKKVKVGMNLYRVYCQVINRRKVFYILRHGKQREIAAEVLGLKG